MSSLRVLGSAVLYGISPILVKVAYGYHVPTLTVLALRASLAAVALWGWCALRRIPVGLPAASRPALLGAGFLLVPLQVFAYFYGLAFLPASTASVLAYTYPLHVAWMGRLFLGERVGGVELALLCVVVGGAVLVAGQTPSAAPAVGLGAIAAATVTAAGYMVVARRIVRDVPPVPAMVVMIPASGVTYWIAAALVPGQLRLAMPGAALAAVAGSSLLSNLFAPLLLLTGLVAMPAAHAAALGTLEPVVTATLSLLVLGDAMSWLRAAGIAVVVAGIAALHLSRRR